MLIWLSAIVDAYKVAKSAGQAAEFYYAKAYVVAMLLLVGPLALPLLWQSPNFSNTARWSVDGDRGRRGADVYRDAVFVEVVDRLKAAACIPFPVVGGLFHARGRHPACFSGNPASPDLDPDKNRGPYSTSSTLRISSDRPR